MSKNRKLRKLTHPQVWLGTPKNGMVECVVLENWGKGPLAARLWVPYEHESKSDVLERFKCMDRVKKRLKLDNGIDLGYYSALYSQQNPLDKMEEYK